MPQTREHFDICRLLGIRHGVVALTKADLADDAMADLVRLDVAELVAGTPLAQAPVLAVSASTGQGLDQLRFALEALAARVEARDEAGAARLPIDRAFTMRGFGTVVTGTLVEGAIVPDQELEITPGERRVRVRGVQVHGARRDRAVAGQRVAVNLSGLEVADVQRGQVLALPGSLPVSKTLDARLTVLPGSARVAHGARVRFHQGTGETLARVAIVGPAAGAEGAEGLGPGMSGLIRLRLESPVALTRGDRFVLRRYSPPLTIAGGVVLDPLPPRGGVRSSATLDRLARLAGPLDRGAPEESALGVFVADAGPRGVTRAELAARGGAHAARGAAAVDRLSARGDLWRVGDRLIAGEWHAALEARVTAALAAHHDAHPLSDGLPREEVRERVLGDAHPEAAEAVVEELIARGAVRGQQRLALSGRGVTLTGEERDAQKAVEEAYLAAGLTPPDVAQLAAVTGHRPDLVGRIVPLLVRQQVLVRVDSLVFHRDALARLKEEVRGLKQSGEARLDVTGFKDRYRLTRKHAIPLLEYLDRERVTRRAGESRVVL